MLSLTSSLKAIKVLVHIAGYEGQFSKFASPKGMKTLKPTHNIWRVGTWRGDNFCNMPIYDHSWSFFCQLHKYISQNLDADGHFEVLNMSKSQLNQKLQHKTQIFIFQFLFNFGRKNLENLWLMNGHFLTIMVIFCQLHNLFP